MEINMKNKKFTFDIRIGGGRIFLGVLFIVAALLMFLEIISDGFNLPVVKIAIGCGLLSWSVYSLFKLRFSQVFFPLAFLCMVLKTEICILFNINRSDLSNISLLIIALFLTIGCGILFDGVRPGHHRHHHASGSTTPTSNTLGESVKYVDCADFDGLLLTNRFGEYNIRFQNTEAFKGDVTLEVSNSFGEMNIYVPKEWNVKFEVSSCLGEAGINGEGAPEGKVLYVSGSNSFGELNVYLV